MEHEVAMIKDETDDPILPNLELWELYAQKLAELKVKEELKRHYSALFEKNTALFEKYTTLLEEMAKNLTQFEKSLRSIEKQVQELHSRVFGKKRQTYTA